MVLIEGAAPRTRRCGVNREPRLQLRRNVTRPVIAGRKFKIDTRHVPVRIHGNHTHIWKDEMALDKRQLMLFSDGAPQLGFTPIGDAHGGDEQAQTMPCS